MYMWKGSDKTGISLLIATGSPRQSIQKNVLKARVTCRGGLKVHNMYKPNNKYQM
jgi:hypothetical protein